MRKVVKYLGRIGPDVMQFAGIAGLNTAVVTLLKVEVVLHREQRQIDMLLEVGQVVASLDSLVHARYAVVQ